MSIIIDAASVCEVTLKFWLKFVETYVERYFDRSIDRTIKRRSRFPSIDSRYRILFFLSLFFSFDNVKLCFYEIELISYVSSLPFSA